jgi:general secretion pathway protein D
MPASTRPRLAVPRRRALRAGTAALAAVLAAAVAGAQPGAPTGADQTTLTPEGLVNLDFQDVEIATVIDTIARLTGRNFVYDDRVRGRVTIISPTPIPVEQAYTVFESVLQVKGFTTVEAPGGVMKVIPIRDAKETSVDTRSVLSAPDSDRFVTRLIPLRYIDAEAISNTLKPLVSKEAALVAYAPTNTVILTDSAANINRILQILESIDVETYKEELAMIRVQYADSQTLAEQLSEVFGGEVSSTTGAAPTGRLQPRVRRPAQVQQPDAGGAQRNRVRIITDARTNALIILAARTTLDEMRALIRKLDVPVEGQGRIQVYYLKHADAEEMAETLNSLLGAGPVGGTATSAAAVAAGVQPQQLRAVSELANAVSSLTADIGTNSLVIQASPEGFEAIRKVIELLDIERPQVLVEALIMEVTVSDARDLGLNWLVQLSGPDTGVTIQQAVDSAISGALGALTRNSKGDTNPPAVIQGQPFAVNVGILDGSNVIQAIIRASENDGDTNIISAPHILTSDNEEAEILVGDNIPIITNRVQSAQGIVTDPEEQSSLATSVNVERQDIGVTLRVTPQITEGDSLRLEIFQEITDINPTLQAGVGDVNQVGPALSNRRVENVVVVRDGATVAIGGLVSDNYSDSRNKVPWLGDIPVLGWLFKSTSTELRKNNLLIFLTPHVIRSPSDLEKVSIGKREEFRRRSEETLGAERERPEVVVEHPVGLLGEVSSSLEEGPAVGAIQALERRYPLERMREIEREQAQSREAQRAAEALRARGARYVLLAGSFADPDAARGTLMELVDAGFDGSLVSSGPAGRVRYELRLGPYTEVEQAERAALTLQRAYGLTSQIVLERREGAP